MKVRPRGRFWPGSSLKHRALASPVRVRILEVLGEEGKPLDASDLGSKLGLHRNTVRAHLKVLAEAGLVQAVREERSEPGRPRVLYTVREKALEGVGSEYRLLAEALAGYLAASDLDAAALGREAGRRMAQKLVLLLGRPGGREEAAQDLAEVFRLAGFWPEVESEGEERRIVLRRCPFKEVARSYPDVVCSVHLGLAQGFLAETGGGLRVRRLEPWAGEDYCLLHLEPVSVLAASGEE